MHRLLCLVLLAACEDDASRGPSCRIVAAQAYAIAEHDAERASVAPDDLRAIAARGANLRDAVVASCTRDRWSSRLRACFAVARDRGAFEACERGLTDEQRATIAATAAPTSW